MKDVIAPAKKIVAREPKVANGGMKKSAGTYNKDCHGEIPAALNVKQIAQKVLRGK